MPRFFGRRGGGEPLLALSDGLNERALRAAAARASQQAEETVAETVEEEAPADVNVAALLASPNDVEAADTLAENGAETLVGADDDAARGWHAHGGGGRHGARRGGDR